MLIKQCRIRNLKRLSFIKKGEKIGFRVDLSHVDAKRLNKLELKQLWDDLLFLPSIVWPVSRFNSEWKIEKLKDLPMEICTSEIFRTRCQRAWRWITKKITDIRYRTYKRYKRVEISPVWIELFMKNGYIYWPTFILWNDDDKIKHTINLFLELFWECEILWNNLKPLIKSWTYLRYNWEFIKPWEWEMFKRKVLSIAENRSNEQKKIIIRRLSVAEKFWLCPVWIGKFWFSWYIAFQSKDKKYTIFENINYGNAIYITDMDRITFSKQDKQTILNSNMQKDRIIHTKWWENDLKKYCL